MLVPVLVIGAIVSIYIGTYMLNKQIPVPEEFREFAADSEACTLCHNHSCSLKK
ncbi:MAG: hypothetical protein J7K80_00395 [Candidatus Izimaplasma sp.]|nr:hypothetical protein [Candidatus Izimaplasma bacterium]